MTDKKATAGSSDESAKKPESASVALINVEPRDRDHRRGHQAEANTAAGAPPVRPAPARDPVASTLAMAASVVALLAAGGGYYLWQELVKVQDAAGRTSGVTQAQLDSTQQALDAGTAKAAAELRADLAATRSALERQTQEVVATANAGVDSLRSEVQQADKATEDRLAQLGQQLSEARAAADKAVLEAKSGLEASLNQATQAVTAEIGANTSNIAELRGTLAEMRSQVTERLSNAEQAQAQLQVLVEQSQRELAEALSRNRLRWSMTELEHLLSLANQQARLQGEVSGAVATLRAADERLQGLDDPGLLEVRSAVQADIAALEATQVPDVDGMALALGRLAEASMSLPLASDRRGSDVPQAAAETEAANVATETADTAWSMVTGFAAAAWDRLRGVVVVRENGGVSAPLLPPEQAYFLQQNMRLQLESARLALLRGDQEAFQSSLGDVSAWATRYHDTEASSVRAFIDEVDLISVTNITVNVPDISSSLRALRDAAAGLASQAQ